MSLQDGLLTDAGELTPIVPADTAAHGSAYLLNGSNKSMDVDGSSTPQVFSYTPSAGEIWIIKDLRFLIFDGGSMDRDDFGSIGGGLTNGLLIEYQTRGTARTLDNLQDNIDISTLFEADFVKEDDKGWMDTDGVFSGIYKLNPGIILDGDNSDYFRATVRDNITGLNELVMKLNKWEALNGRH